MAAYLWAIASLAAMGGVFGLALGFAAKRFEVHLDPRIEEISKILPGANCGACGYPGCMNYATEVAGGKTGPGRCPVGGSEVATRIARIMGKDEEVSVARNTARLFCGGSTDKCGQRFSYIGIRDCKAADLVGGGFKACPFGCLGLGTCVEACQFGAMKMGQDGLPVIDRALCTGCGRCVSACPKKVIGLVDDTRPIVVACSSTARGPEVRKTCKVGCIACNACVKVCPNQAIVMENNLARIIYERCDGCGKCIEECPTKCIVGRAEQAAPVVERAG